MLGLPFREVWTLDFEFVSEPGDLPVPVCMVARELGSNKLIRLWQDELGAAPPFSTGDDVLFVAYFASAEIGCFLSLGWPVPTRILDLFIEFRNATNGIHLPNGRGLLGALAHYGITSITADQKHEERALVMGGGPWAPEEQIRILDYCQTDVDPMGALLEPMLPGIVKRPNGLGQALLRGRYMVAVARMERTGVPIDIEMLDLLRSNWENIKLDLIGAIDKDYGVYEGTTFIMTTNTTDQYHCSSCATYMAIRQAESAIFLNRIQIMFAEQKIRAGWVRYAEDCPATRARRMAGTT